MLASLNHPHIAAIYGFDESGSTQFLVLELVEGETLADRINRGPIPVDETIAIARQIAEALAEAHEKGIIHRDLKPANIALSGHDQVKVLDFGLAKLTSAPGGSASSSVSMSPTLTTPAMMTGVGMILGTAAYMAPEQAKGREADKRCDVWAFRLRRLRDADRAAGVRRRGHHRHDRRDHARRAGLERAARRHAGESAPAARIVSDQRSQTESG